MWSLAYEGKIKGYISALTYPNIHYVLRRLTGQAQAGKALRIIRSTFTTVSLDDQILNQAMDAGLPDFEDAIQFFSAVHAGVDCIVTRDTSHFRHSSLPVLSPSEFLAKQSK